MDLHFPCAINLSKVLGDDNWLHFFYCTGWTTAQKNSQYTIPPLRDNLCTRYISLGS